MFAGYYKDLQERIANTWRITPEVVTQYQGITKFKETRHIIWIQAWKELENEWLQLRYCVKEEDIEMVIKDWHDEWRVPTIDQDMFADKEVDAGKEKRPTGDKIAPNNPNLGHNLAQYKKGGASKKGTRAGKNKDTQAP
jgi:hypothetical protein